jgi:hypothetical protein
MEFKNKLYCITGKLKSFPCKKSAWEEIINRGGYVSKDLTQTCDYLVLGALGSIDYAFDHKGTKQTKAEEWIQNKQSSIKIITESCFCDSLEASDIVEEKGKLINNSSCFSEILSSRYEEITINSCTFKYDEIIHKKLKNINQLFRFKFFSYVNQGEYIYLWDKLKVFENILADSNFKSKIEIEGFPARWIIPENDNSAKLYSIYIKFLILIDSDIVLNKTKSLPIEILNILSLLNVSGDVKVRYWNETSKYAKYFINQISVSPAKCPNRDPITRTSQGNQDMNR